MNNRNRKEGLFGNGLNVNAEVSEIWVVIICALFIFFSNYICAEANVKYTPNAKVKTVKALPKGAKIISITRALKGNVCISYELGDMMTFAYMTTKDAKKYKF